MPVTKEGARSEAATSLDRTPTTKDIIADGVDRIKAIKFQKGLSSHWMVFQLTPEAHCMAQNGQWIKEWSLCNLSDTDLVMIVNACDIELDFRRTTSHEED